MLLRDGNGTTSPSSLGALSSAAFMTCFWKMITVPPINDGGGGDGGGGGDAKMAAVAGIQLQQKNLNKEVQEQRDQRARRHEGKDIHNGGVSSVSVGISVSAVAGVTSGGGGREWGG